MIFVKESLTVMGGGAFGCFARFALSRWVQTISHHRDYPWGIFVCNVLGCLMVGILAGVLVHRLQLGPLWRSAIFIGFLGGFTTFSSFSIDTITMMQQGDMMSALSNIVLTVFFCLVATAGGLLITRALLVS